MKTNLRRCAHTYTYNSNNKKRRQKKLDHLNNYSRQETDRSSPPCSSSITRARIPASLLWGGQRKQRSKYPASFIKLEWLGYWFFSFFLHQLQNNETNCQTSVFLWRPAGAQPRSNTLVSTTSCPEAMGRDNTLWSLKSSYTTLRPEAMERDNAKKRQRWGRLTGLKKYTPLSHHLA